MGDNGAGKSTLVKMIAGNFQPSEGEICLDGARPRFARPLDARQNGASRSSTRTSRSATT